MRASHEYQGTKMLREAGTACERTMMKSLPLESRFAIAEEQAHSTHANWGRQVCNLFQP
jgi:hypothetical protein